MRIIIYIDIDNTIPEALLNHQCEYLTHKDINLPKQIILPEFLVNKHLYENIDNTNIDKKDQFVFFLDNKTNIPDQLQKLLYPHTKLPIKLFNGSSIQHYQHLGYLNEADRKSVLLDSKVFIYDDTQYIIEAMLCKCSLIDLQTINKCENLQDIQSNIIDTYSYDHYKYYEEFIKEL
jgi:hypothetical protein